MSEVVGFRKTGGQDGMLRKAYDRLRGQRETMRDLRHENKRLQRAIYSMEDEVERQKKVRGQCEQMMLAMQEEMHWLRERGWVGPSDARRKRSPRRPYWQQLQDSGAPRGLVLVARVNHERQLGHEHNIRIAETLLQAFDKSVGLRRPRAQSN